MTAAKLDYQRDAHPEAADDLIDEFGFDVHAET
jgi:hypothetical protein